VLPHHEGLRPWWLLRLGLFLYDHLGGRQLLPATRSLDLRQDEAGEPLQPRFHRAFEYSDCWVEDARLVVLNARDAAERGARILPRTKVVGARRRADHWLVTTQAADGTRAETSARTLVNAAGPWVADVLNDIVPSERPASVRLVQGSHIVVPRLFEHERCYIFQNGDGRIVFAIPYEGDFTLIGTTDRDYRGDPAKVAASEDEIAYLCAAAGEYFRREIQREDVVWTYSGVRPLYDDGASKAQEATRDYVLKLDEPAGSAPLLSVFGGKITTSRRLAEAAVQKLAAAVPALRAAPWTAGASLPGGDFPVEGFEGLVERLCASRPWLDRKLARRLARAYGTRAEALLEGARAMADLGEVFGADLTEREVAWLMAQEWAMTAEDVLFRRSKLGLRFSAEQRQALDDYMTAQAARTPAMAAHAEQR
uniref:glycerol-3-phosphate dehydrogenase n=1 Tax=Bosea sp. (in: a-proteobacteria) TaxID=1871050 RepID=UPI002FCB9810